MSSQQFRITLAGSEHVVEAGTTAGAALGPEPGVSRRPGQRRAARPGVPGRRRRRRRAGRTSPATTAAPSCGTRPRTSWRRPCRSCSRRPSSASGRRSRTASTTTSTCEQAVHPGRPEGDREADARDRQAGPAVLPPGGDRRRGPGRARRRAVQARADRPQGRTRGRRRRASRSRSAAPS